MYSVNFGQTIVDRPLLNRMAKLEQNQQGFRQPLVTNLVKDLNEATEKTGDTAYLFAGIDAKESTKTGLPVEINIPAEQEEKITPISLTIIDNKGVVKYSQDGVIADKKGEILFSKKDKLDKYLAKSPKLDTFA